MMLRHPVLYFNYKKKILCCVFFIGIALGLFQYLFLTQNANGKYDVCLNDVIFSSQKLKDIKCSILQVENQEICQEHWKNSDNFVSDDQVQKRLSNCSNYFSMVKTTAFLPRLEMESSIAFSIVVHNQIGSMLYFKGFYSSFKSLV